jgi:hypothetical protein
LEKVERVVRLGQLVLLDQSVQPDLQVVRLVRLVHKDLQVVLLVRLE